MSGPSLASVREPILTITRRARATTARGSVAVMLDEIVESRVEPPGQAPGYPGHTLEGAVQPRAGGVDIVEARPRTKACDRDGTHEGPIDRHAETGRFVHIDDQPKLRRTVREVPVEQSPEHVRLDRSLQRHEESNRSQGPQGAGGDSISRDA